MSLRMFLPVILPACVFLCSSTHSFSVAKATQSTIDFSAKRLSGNRVLLSWHTRGEGSSVRFEVLRTFSRKAAYQTIGTAMPQKPSGSWITDYRFVDADNESSDTSFYCLKKTRADGVIFYSIVLGVPGERK